MSEYQLTPKEQKVLNDAVDEAVDSKIREDGERQFRKDVASRVLEEVGFEKAKFNALVAERFDNKASNAIEKYQDTVDLNELLLANNKRSSTDPVDDEQEA